MNKGRVEQIEAEHQPKGLSAKTVRNINQVISSAMDFAVAQKIISETPCRAVALPKIEHGEMQTIPAEQLHAFLNEARATGVYEMYYIEQATSLRRIRPGYLYHLSTDHGEFAEYVKTPNT